MPWAAIKGKLIATIKTDEGNWVIHSPKTLFATDDTHLRSAPVALQVAY